MFQCKYIYIYEHTAIDSRTRSVKYTLSCLTGSTAQLTGGTNVTVNGRCHIASATLVIFAGC